MSATESNIANLPAKRISLVARIAAKYEIDADKMLDTMKATCFRQRPDKSGHVIQVSNEQMMALLVVAENYNLNPFTKEIYAFPNNGGIEPIVSVDGWIRIINEHPQYDSQEFVYAPPGTEDPWIECTIWRRDRSRPTTVREYLDECIRDTAPWKSHPRRMLRHKALIQCARLAFGFGGIYDPDEAERIANAMDVTPKTAEPRSRFVNEIHPEPENIGIDTAHNIRRIMNQDLDETVIALQVEQENTRLNKDCPESLEAAWKVLGSDERRAWKQWLDLRKTHDGK